MVTRKKYDNILIYQFKAFGRRRASDVSNKRSGIILETVGPLVRQKHICKKLSCLNNKLEKYGSGNVCATSIVYCLLYR